MKLKRLAIALLVRFSSGQTMDEWKPGPEIEFKKPAIEQHVKDGSLEGVFASGIAEVSGLVGDALVIDTTESPQWLKNLELGEGMVRFQAEENHRYLVADATRVLAPEVRDPLPIRLSTMQSGAQYVVIAPEAFLEAAGASWRGCDCHRHLRNAAPSGDRT